MNSRFNLHSTDSRGTDPYKTYNPPTSSSQSSEEACPSSNTSSVAEAVIKGVAKTVLVSAITGNPILGAESLIEAAVDTIADSL